MSRLFVALCLAAVASCASGEAIEDEVFGVEPRPNWGCTPGAKYDELEKQWWCENLDLADRAYNTRFMQDILHGTLWEPELFRFTKEDMYWTSNIVRIWGEACDRRYCPPVIEQCIRGAAAAYENDMMDAVATFNTTISERPDRESWDFIMFEERVDFEYPIAYDTIPIASDARLWLEIMGRLKVEGAMENGGFSAVWVDFVLKNTQQLVDSKNALNTPGIFDDVELARGLYREALEKNVVFMGVYKGNYIERFVQ